MRKLRSYTSISLDGFFTDAKGDMSWAHKRDDEWNAFASSNASGNAALLFGRVTYEQMKAFWPTPQAAQMMPEVAAGMNRMPKYVVSRTLDAADWQNTTVLKGDLVQGNAGAEGDRRARIWSSSAAAASCRSSPRPGSSTSTSSCSPPSRWARAGRRSRPSDDRRTFTLKKTKSFTNGNVVLWYEPA